MANALRGKVCLVTGGSRGIGRGIALQLAQHGAVVYVTGRSAERLRNDVVAEARRRRADADVTACEVDHADELAVERLFKRIAEERDNRLDLLVNNAYAAVDYIMRNVGKPFFEDREKSPGEAWDIVNNVGLRNHYVCAVHAARLMSVRNSGLIVNISSAGGLYTLFNAVYGAGKAAVDKMAVDCAKDLRKFNVAFVSLWPGAVRTETVTEKVLENEQASKESKRAFSDAESVEFAGKAVVNLASDPNIMSKTGKILLTADLAREYGFVDEDGEIHCDIRNVKRMLDVSGYKYTAMFVPSFVFVPRWVLHLIGNKF